MRQSAAVYLGLMMSLAASGAETIRGRIVQDHSGDAAVSARVRIRAPSGEIVADRDADTAGRFETPPLAEGPYRIEVSKPGYLPASLETVHPGPPIAIRLTRLGVIAGRVLDGQQKPIEGAFVFPLAVRGGEPAPLPPVETPASGEYRLHRLPPGRYLMAVSRSNYQRRPGAGAFLFPANSAPTEFEITGGEEHLGVDFVFPAVAGHRVSGRVEGADADTSFAVGLASRERPVLGISVTKTDDEGRFTLDGVPPGSYHVFASGPVGGHSWRGAIVRGEALYGRSTLDVGGEVADLALTVEPPRTALAMLELDSPEAAKACPPSAEVRLTALEEWGTEHRIIAPLSAGKENRIDGLPPGLFRAAATDLPDGCF